ncbi:MAG: hypothetical protein J0665_18755 [Deltaproteobacteria bacterium]|nr:hypothetical protein [Deltaproteobacteria bacterium]
MRILSFTVASQQQNSKETSNLQNETAINIPLPQRVKIIMTSALDDPRTVIKALFESDANSYLTKPVTVQNIGDELRNLKLIS